MALTEDEGEESKDQPPVTPQQQVFSSHNYFHNSLGNHRLGVCVQKKKRTAKTPDDIQKSIQETVNKLQEIAESDESNLTRSAANTRVVTGS